MADLPPMGTLLHWTVSTSALRLERVAPSAFPGCSPQTHPRETVWSRVCGSPCSQDAHGTGRRAPRGSASPQRSVLTSVALASRKGGTLVIPTNPFILCHTALKVPIGRTPAAGRSQPSVLTSAMTPGVLDPTRRTNLINHETIVVTVLQCPFHVQRGVAPGAAGCAGGWGLCHCP